MVNITVKVQKPDPVDLSAKSAKTTVSGIVDGKYTGNGVTQSKLTVKAGGKTLTKDKDYRVTYKNNKNVGKATITITGKFHLLLSRTSHLFHIHHYSNHNIFHT